jgi:hypothetical protein
LKLSTPQASKATTRATKSRDSGDQRRRDSGDQRRRDSGDQRAPESLSERIPHQAIIAVDATDEPT